MVTTELPLQPLCAEQRHYHGEYAAHTHDHAQLLFGLQGRLELEVDGHASVADSSCAVLVPPGAAHGFVATQQARLWVLDLPPARGLDRLRRFAVTPGWQALRAPAAAIDAEQLATLLGSPALAWRRGIDLQRLGDTLDTRLHEHWPTARLAALFFLSPQRFHARLLELTGLPPQAWLRQRRLQRASTLIARGQSLDHTALQVGYRSASALATALRRELGTGARGLRRR